MECPDPTLVSLFVRGGLPDGDVSRFEAHLDRCDGCLLRIADLAGSSTASTDVVGSPEESSLVHLVAALARRSNRAPPFLPSTPRERFGPYRVVGTVGRGAMGIVYRAVHVDSGKVVAIKTVAGTNPKVLAAMRQEILFLEQQGHPGIVQIFESGVIDGDPWYAMELLEGTTLAAFNQSLWPTPPTEIDVGRSDNPRREAKPSAQKPPAAGGRLDEVLGLYVRLCGPLGFVHRAGIVHCDLKPANVFIRRDGQPVLMDFGLLSRAGGAIGRESLEVGGRLRGTLPYISPELVRGKIPDARADLYALGCMLFESVVGRPPFRASTINGLIEAHLHLQPQPPSELVSDVPPGLDALIARLLAKRPEDRIGDTDAVAQLLAAANRTPDSPRTSSVASTPYLFRPRLVGREPIVEQFEEFITDAERGHGRFVLLSGESGIGKTFLASEIAQRAARAGFEVVTGECTPVAPARSAGQEIIGGALEPFRNLLQHASDRCRAAPEMVSRLFGSDLSVRLLARYEPSLQHLPKTTDDVATLPPNAERDRILQALSDLFDRLSQDAPLLLVIDDLQWADDLSLAFLTSLPASAFADKRLLVIGLYRSEEVTKPIADLEGLPHVRSIRLGPLDKGALTALAGDLLSNIPPGRFIETLADHAEGNPYFVAEYLRAAATEGLLEHGTSGWRLAARLNLAGSDGSELALPASLQALLERRLAALDEATQHVIEAAAVLGREFRLPMLASVTGVTEEKLIVGEMIQRQLVERLSGGNLRFLHDKMREAAYARIDAARRTLLHGRAALVIEQTYANTEGFSAHYAEVAYHLRRAGETARAIDYFEKAGTHALRSSANADAVRLFGEATQLMMAETIPVAAERRASWERMTGDALVGLGDLESSKRHLLQAVALSGWPMAGTPVSIGFAILSNIARQVLHRVLPGRWIEADSPRSRRLLEGARAYDRLQQLFYHRGEYLLLLLANLTTLNLSERAPPSSHLATAYANAGATAGIIPLRNAAKRYFELAEATLAEAYDADVEMYLRMLHAVYLVGLGDRVRAMAAATRSLELANQLGFPRRWEETAGVVVIATSDLDERLSWSEKALQSAKRRGDPQMTSWCLLRRADVYATRGEYHRASEAVHEVEGTLSRLGALEHMWLYATQSYLSLAAGDLKTAATVADEALALAKKAGAGFVGVVEAYSRIAEVELALWMSAPAASVVERAARARAACGTLAAAARIFPIAVPSYCLCEGTRRWQLGQKKRASSMWQRGLVEARRLDLPHREAQLLFTTARYLGPSPSTREARDLGQDIAIRLGIQDDSMLTVGGPPHSTV